MKLKLSRKKKTVVVKFSCKKTFLFETTKMNCLVYHALLEYFPFFLKKNLKWQ